MCESGMAFFDCRGRFSVLMKFLLKTNSLVFLAYLLSSALGLLLAFSPAQPAPVWPAAGVALAVVLLYGYGVLVGVFCAKLILQIAIGSYWNEALLISTGVVFQAFLGAYLVRRFTGYPNLLVRFSDVLSFLFWGGLVASLPGASSGIVALWLFGYINQEGLLFAWASWWVGDTIGVLFVTPVLLAWLSPVVSQWRPRRMAMSGSIILALGALVAYSSFNQYWEGRQLRAKFEHEGRALYQRLISLRDEQVGVLHSLRDFFLASDDVTREDFNIYVGSLLSRTPRLQSLSWNPLVSSDRRQLFESQMQQDGLTGYQITERDSQGAVSLAATRDEYVPVAYIEPMSVNQRALGYDLYSSVERRQVLVESRSTGKVTASKVVILAAAEKVGLVLSLPVVLRPYSEFLADQVDGFVVGVFKLGDALELLLDSQIKPGITYRLLDVTDPGSGVQIYAYGAPLGKEISALKPLFQQLLDPLFEQRFEFEFAGRGWALELVADGRYQIANQHVSAWILLFGGLIIACLVSMFVTLMTGRDYKLRRSLEDRAEVIRQKDDQLMVNQFALDHLSTGVLLVDQHGRFVYANQAACDDLEYSPSEMLELDIGDINADFDMADWPEHWARLKQEGGLRFETTHQSKYQHQRSVEVIANYFEHAEGGFNLAFVRDISLRKTHQSQLRKLSAAIEQSPVSVLITDLSGTIEYVNPALLRITGYELEEVLGQNPRMFKSGQTTEATYASMWRVLSSGGVWFGEFCNRCKDGSLIWESASITVILDDVGVPSHYLAVKENITASRRARELLKQSEQMLKRAQSLAHVGSWELDFTTGKLAWSDETCRIFGLEPETTLDYQRFLSFVHTDDQERLDNAWLSALEGENYDIEHRIVVNDAVKTVQQRAQFEFDAQGNVLRGIGTIHDVTERVQAGAALQNSEELYRSLVTALSEGILLRDAEGKIKMFNPAASHILGSTLAGMLESPPGQSGVQCYRDNGEAFPVDEFPSVLTLASGESSRDIVMGLDLLEGGRIWLSVNTEPLCHQDEVQPYAVVVSFQDITRRRQAEDELKRLAATDILTGLLNRRACSSVIEQELARRKRLPSSEPCALLMMDLDSFKSINDHYGHAVGDQALAHFSRLIKTTQRQPDIAGRWGGEEFVMLLPGTDLIGAKTYAERLRSLLSASPIMAHGVPVKLTVSIGVALLDPADSDSDAALVRADGAMYRAKSEGRNRVVSEQDFN